MGRRWTINDRRLTKQQVQELLATGAVFHPDLTAVLHRLDDRDTAYALPDGNILLVHGLPGIQGKGDIWPPAAFLKLVSMTSPNTPLRLIFMGTPEFAVPTLETLLAWPGAQVVAVITAPDKPAGRGRQLAESAVKQAALAHGVPVLQPTNLKAPEFQQELRGYAADLQVVVAFRMLPELVWNMPRLGSINIHASLLPQYRGAAPINWALIHGEGETGVTSFFLQHEIDTGNLIFQDVVPIADEDDFGALYEKLKAAGARLALRTVQAIADGTAPSIPQAMGQELRAAPKIQKETGRLDVRQPAAALGNLVRGLSPIPTAFTQLPDGRTLKIFRAQAMPQDGASATPGTWTTDGRTYLRLQTGTGPLDLLDVQLEGKKRMSVVEFLRGFNTATLTPKTV